MLRTLLGAIALLALGYLALCLLLYVSQRKLIYLPPPRLATVPSITLQRPDATIVVSVGAGADSRANATRVPANARTVVYFGGNAEDVSRSLDELATAFPDATLFAMHYRGYGGSTGPLDEAALVADGIALVDHVAAGDTASHTASHSASHTAGQPRIVLIGRSLGSAVAIQVAAARRAEQLILVTPFDSLSALAARQYPFVPTRWLLKDTWQSVRHAAALTLPVTVIVAEQDEVIPVEHSAALINALPPARTKTVRIPGAGHNDLSLHPAYRTALAEAAAASASAARPGQEDHGVDHGKVAPDR